MSPPASASQRKPYECQKQIPIIVTPPKTAAAPNKASVPTPPRPPLPHEVRVPGRPPMPGMADTDDEDGLFTDGPGQNRPIHAAAHGLYQEVRQVKKIKI